MPKIGRMPERQKQFADELRNTYGGMLTLKQVGEVIGITHPQTIKKFAQDIPAVDINGRKKWMAADVARKIESCRLA